MPEAPPVVLTIAGFDPSSGAGVTADIKTIAAHGCYGVACITALTVQSTAGVRRVHPVETELVAETLAELVAEWDAAHERHETIESVKRGLTDIGAGATFYSTLVEVARAV